MKRSALSKPGNGELVRIVVLVSGNGTTLQALIDAERQGCLGGGSIEAVLTDRPGVYALERAKVAGIPVYTAQDLPGKPQQELSDWILHIARTVEADLIILAGFLSILAGDLLKMYRERMINLHPSLLPAFGGQGMYGERVHRAVLAAGARESGCTVHIVDAGTDTGPILLQRRVPVLPGDSPQDLAERVHQAEQAAIVEAAAFLVSRIRQERIIP
ncbi:MAG: phosphoribosylglycinamide formyltransferase [Treponema sp.]|jgi:phosphoribosylglycinamide formyltransferase-1|nr:phosphoribosylglycinamide formyltransferase [Treponema sp.]